MLIFTIVGQYWKSRSGVFYSNDTLAGSDWLAPVVPGAQISGWVLKDVQLCSWRIGEMMSAGKTVAWKKSIALNTHKSFILEVITPHTLLIMAQVIFQVIKYPNIQTKTEIDNCHIFKLMAFYFVFCVDLFFFHLKKRQLDLKKWWLGSLFLKEGQYWAWSFFAEPTGWLVLTVLQRHATI